MIDIIEGLSKTYSTGKGRPPLRAIGENCFNNTKNWSFVGRLKACENDQGSASV